MDEDMPGRATAGSPASGAHGLDSAPGALAGVVVAEFGHYVAGPLLGVLLADQGARVIKVEPPGGDAARGLAGFAAYNRDKESVVLDLRRDDDRDAATELIARADVVVENFRPGVAQRLGIGYEDARRVRPDLIYCSLPGFPSGDRRREWAAWEGLVAAATGVYRGRQADGHQFPDEDGDPIYTPLSIPSTYAAVIAAGAIAAALHHRAACGRGQAIEVSLYRAMFAAMGMDMVEFEDLRLSDARLEPKLPIAEQYRCADGRYVQSHGVYERLVRRFCDAVGRSEWADEAVETLRHAASPQVEELWRARFAEIFAQRDAEDWEANLTAAGGVCAVCRTPEEWLAADHPWRAGILIKGDDGEGRDVTLPGAAVRLRGTAPRSRPRPPRLDEHGAEIRRWLSRPADREGAEPRRTESENHPRSEATDGDVGLPLRGVRVLDLCIILAGPSCGRTLAEYGADVVRIEAPDRPAETFLRPDVQRGKRSIGLDLRSEAGQAVFWRLVDSADVVLESFRPGRLDALGLGYAAISERRPQVVYGAINAFGHGGPWSDRPGWEQIAEAVTGMQVRHGGDSAHPRLMTYPLCDYATGIIAAFGVMVALRERRRTGRGQRVETGLAVTATLLQADLLDPPVDGVADGRYGPHWNRRLYATADGWIFVEAPEPDAWARLVTVDGCGALRDDPRFVGASERGSGDLESELQRIFVADTTERWLARLADAGVGAVQHVDSAQLARTPSTAADGLTVRRRHPGLGWVRHTGPTPILSGTPPRVGRPCGIRGAESIEILTECGYRPDEIERLLNSGAVFREAPHV